MRLWRFGPGSNSSDANGRSSAWIIYTPPAIRNNDLRPLVMIVAVFMGFLFAIHYADSPKLFKTVEQINAYLNPLFEDSKTANVVEPDALVLTQDKAAELAAVATIGPRGLRPVPTASTQDALILLRDTGRTWKLAVIDSSIPGFPQMADALKNVIPDRNIIVVQGHKGAQAISRTLLERLETLTL